MYCQDLAWFDYLLVCYCFWVIFFSFYTFYWFGSKYAYMDEQLAN